MTNILSDLTMQGDINVGSNNIAMTGNLSSSSSPAAEGWFADLNVNQLNALTSAGAAVQARTDGDYPTSGYVGETIVGQSRVNYSSVVTISIASPAVVSYTASQVSTGVGVFFTTTGSLPTGLLPNTNYYAIRIDANSFSLATSVANAHAGIAVNTSGSQSGTHTCYIGVRMANNVPTDMMGLMIPAGVWAFSGTGWHTGVGGATPSLICAAITATSGATPSYYNGSYYLNGITAVANAQLSVGTATWIYSFSSPTIIYFTLRTAFTAGGYNIGNGCLNCTRIA